MIFRYTAPIFMTLLVLLFFFACAGVEEAPIPTPEPEPAPVEMAPEPEPEALDLAWEGSVWIAEEMSVSHFPGYMGFELGKGGQLRLIGLPNTQGIDWLVDGNRMVLHSQNRSPLLPAQGEFRIFDAGKGAKNQQRIRLETLDKTLSLTFFQSRPRVDLIENHWIPQFLRGGESIPWPLNREIHLMFLPDATGNIGLLGYGGVNRFRGPVDLGEGRFTPGRIASSRKTGPGSEFEELYIRRLKESNHIVRAGDDLFLYQETLPTAGFRVRLFD
ncbi:MAG: META domain-containing protein [Spirochaetales bacterium]|nr:META domain-containing protein [Spirochaetales bacterium]